MWSNLRSHWPERAEVIVASCTKMHKHTHMHASSMPFISKHIITSSDLSLIPVQYSHLRTISQKLFSLCCVQLRAQLIFTVIFTFFYFTQIEFSFKHCKQSNHCVRFCLERVTISVECVLFVQALPVRNVLGNFRQSVVFAIQCNKEVQERVIWDWKVFFLCVCVLMLESSDSENGTQTKSDLFAPTCKQRWRL